MNYYNEIPPNHNISTHASDTYAKRALDLKKKKESIFHESQLKNFEQRLENSIKRAKQQINQIEHKMSFISIETQNPYFMTMLITLLGMILRSSLQVMVVKFADMDSSAGNRLMLLQLFQGSVVFKQFIIILVFTMLIITQLMILVKYQGLMMGEITIRLLFPLQVHLACTLYNTQHANSLGYLIVTMQILEQYWYRLSVVIVQVITAMFQYRFHSGKYTRSLAISKLYDILWDVNLLLPAFGVLLVERKQQLVVLVIILLVLNVVKSTLFAAKITYETPVLQYCGYVGEFYSWMSLVQLSLFTFFNTNPTAIQWLILIISLLLITKPNELIITLMQIKYMKQFKKQQALENVTVNISSSIDNLSGSDTAEKSMFTLMKKISIVIFMQGEFQIAANFKMDRSNTSEKPFFNFSENFIHQVKQSKYMQGSKANMNLGVEQNQQQYLNIWLYIEKNPIILSKKFYNFQRFLIYNLPIQNNISHLRLVQLFYSWFSEMQNKNFTTTDNSNSFRENIHRRLDYMYLRARIDSQFTFEKKLIQNGIDTKRQVMKDKSKRQYCLDEKEQKYFSWKFEQSFDQSQFQQRIHNQMAAFFETEHNLINLLASKEVKEKFHIFKHLVQRNRKKNNVFSIFEQYSISRRTIKCTIYQFMITKYILKLPKLATRELRQRMQAISKVKVQLLDEDKDKFTVVISGMRQKGFVIHTDSMFKQKMEIKQLREDYQNSKRLHINDLMMQFYQQKHLQALEGLNYMSESMRSFHNTRRKGMFMQSLVTQRLFQISFNINFMTRSIHDIYLVMDITYKQVGSLTVYKNNSKVFQKKSPLKQSSISTIQQSDPLIKHYTPKCHTRSTDEMIFDEKYHFEYQYIDEKYYQGDLQQRESEIHFVEEEQVDARLLQTKERDLQTYRKGKHFNKRHWMLFTISMFIVPLILAILTYILTLIATHDQQQNKNSYLTNYIIQNQFFLTDLKSFNAFFAYLIFNSNYIVFQDQQQKSGFFDSWRYYTLEELRVIDVRGKTVGGNLLQRNTLTPYLFAPLNQNQSSFIYKQLRYDVQFNNIHSYFGNISTQGQFQQTGNISDSAPNSAQSSQLITFYTQNFRDYSQYTLSENSVFSSLQSVVTSQLGSQRTLFTAIVIVIILICVISAVVFAAVYMNLKFKVLEMVEMSFSFNESNIILMRKRLNQLQELLKTSERSSSCTLVEKLGIVSKKKMKSDGKILSNTAFKRSDSFEMPQMNVLKHSRLQIIIFILIFFGFTMIIYSFDHNSASQINMIDQYLQGTQQLVQITGKALYLFNCLIDTIQSPTPISPLIPSYIQGLLTIDRVAILRKLFPSQQMLNQITFQPMCPQHSSMPCYHNQYVNQTYMQTMSRIAYLSGTVYSTLLRVGKFGKISQQPIFELFNQVSMMTAMIRQMLQQVEDNFISQLQQLSVYFYYVCGYVVVYFVVMGAWVYMQAYKKNRIYSEEMLSLVTYDEMLRISDFHYYLRDIESQQWIDDHQHY